MNTVQSSRFLFFRGAIYFGVLLTVWSQISFASATADAPELDQRVSALRKEFSAILHMEIANGKRVEPERFEDSFNKIMGNRSYDNLAEIDDGELRSIYQALHLLNFHIHDPVYAQRLMKISTELANRKVVIRNTMIRKNHYEATYWSLINARLFDLAEDFSRKYREVDAPRFKLTPFVDDALLHPSTISVTDENGATTLSTNKIDLDAGKKIVVITHPHCTFSQAALEYIQNDENLAREFSQRSLWVTRQGATRVIDSIIEWNNRSNAADIEIVYDQEKWPKAILFSLTPMFYFLDDGKIVHQFHGWVGEESVENLEAGFKSLEEND